jgi:hypothetical protein
MERPGVSRRTKNGFTREDIGQEICGGIDGVVPKIGDADAAEHFFIGKEIAGAGEAVLDEEGVGGVEVHVHLLIRNENDGRASEYHTRIKIISGRPIVDGR